MIPETHYTKSGDVNVAYQVWMSRPFGQAYQMS